MDESVIVHNHNDLDSPKLYPEDSLNGFRVIKVANATVAPTDKPQNGIIRFLYDTTPRYRIWVRINNGWRVATLT